MRFPPQFLQSASTAVPATAAVPMPRRFKKARLLIFFMLFSSLKRGLQSGVQHRFPAVIIRALHLVSFDIDCRKRPCRTQILTCTATDTALFVHRRHKGRRHVGLVKGHHFNSAHGAMACTIAALYAVGHGHTVLFHPHGMAYMHSRFFRHD